MNYTPILKQLQELTQGVSHPIANLANAAALLWQSMDSINWAGFYLLENGMLVLGPFQGKPACIEIPVGKGVCGTAVALDKTILVEDVHAFPGHIACDCDSRSEIVIPLRKNGQILGVLDIDSPIMNRFTQEDRIGLEQFAELLASAL